MISYATDVVPNGTNLNSEAGSSNGIFTAQVHCSANVGIGLVEYQQDRTGFTDCIAIKHNYYLPVVDSTKSYKMTDNEKFSADKVDNANKNSRTLIPNDTDITVIVPQTINGRYSYQYTYYQHDISTRLPVCNILLGNGTVKQIIGSITSETGRSEYQIKVSTGIQSIKSIIECNDSSNTNKCKFFGGAIAKIYHNDTTIVRPVSYYSGERNGVGGLFLATDTSNYTGYWQGSNINTITVGDRFEIYVNYFTDYYYSYKWSYYNRPSLEIDTANSPELSYKYTDKNVNTEMAINNVLLSHINVLITDKNDKTVYQEKYLTDKEYIFLNPCINQKLNISVSAKTTDGDVIKKNVVFEESDYNSDNSDIKYTTNGIVMKVIQQDDNSVKITWKQERQSGSLKIAGTKDIKFFMFRCDCYDDGSLGEYKLINDITVYNSDSFDTDIYEEQTMIDYTVSNNHKYKYRLISSVQPYMNTNTTSTNILTYYVVYTESDIINVSFGDWQIGSLWNTNIKKYSRTVYQIKDTWNFECEVKDNNITTVLNIQTNESSGQRPITTRDGTDYESGSFSAMLYTLDCSIGEYVDTFAKVKAWKKFISQDCLFMLKSPKGDVWYIAVSDNPTRQYDNSYNELPTTVTYNWIESEDTDKVIIIK